MGAEASVGTWAAQRQERREVDEGRRSHVLGGPGFL
jgi:hypothetical protein